MSNSTVTNRTKFVSPSNQFRILFYYEGSQFYVCPKELYVGVKIRPNHNLLPRYRIIQKLSNEGEHFFIVEREGEAKDEKENPKMLLLGYKESDPSFEIARPWYRHDFRMDKIVSEHTQPRFSSDHCLNGHLWWLHGREPDYTLGFASMKSIVVLTNSKKEEPKVETHSQKFLYVHKIANGYCLKVMGSNHLMEPSLIKQGMTLIPTDNDSEYRAFVNKTVETPDSFAFEVTLENKSKMLLVYRKNNQPFEFYTGMEKKEKLTNYIHENHVSGTNHISANQISYKLGGHESGSRFFFYYKPEGSKYFLITEKEITPCPKVEPKKMKYTYLYNLSGGRGVWAKSGDMGFQLTKPEQLKEGMVISSRETPEPLNAIIRQKWESSDSFAFRIEKEDKSTQLLIYPKEGPPIEYLISIGVSARIVGKKCRHMGIGDTRLVCTDINGNSYERIWNTITKAKQHFAISGLTGCWCTEEVEEEPVQKTPKKGFIVNSKPTRLQIFRGSQNVDIILHFKDVQQSDILKRSDGELFFVMSCGDGKTDTEEFRTFIIQKLNYSTNSPVEYYTLVVDSNGNELLKVQDKYGDVVARPIASYGLSREAITKETEALYKEFSSMRTDIAELRKAVYDLTENLLKGQQTLIKGQTILQETLEEFGDDADLQQIVNDLDELDFSDPSKDKVLFADRVRRLITDSLRAVIKINPKPTIHDVVKEMNERLD